MRRPLSVVAALSLVSVPWLLLHAGDPFAVVRLLGQPAEVMCSTTAGKPVTLPELAKLVTRFHKLPVIVDEPAFQKANVDLATTKFPLPIKRGLRVSAVLQYVLDNELPVRATFKIGGEGIFIHPGEAQILQEQDPNGLVAQKIKSSRLTTPGGNSTLGQVLTLFESIGGPPFLVAKRQFKEAGREDYLSTPVKVSPQKAAPLGPVLDNVLSQAKAASQIKYDYVLIVPTGKAKKK